MASIEKRKSKDNSTSYRVKVRLKGCPTQTATFERLTDARKWVQQTESAIREGRHFKTVEAKRHTVAEMIDRYVRDVFCRPKSQAGIRNGTWIGGKMKSGVTCFLILPQH